MRRRGFACSGYIIAREAAFFALGLGRALSHSSPPSVSSLSTPEEEGQKGVTSTEQRPMTSSAAVPPFSKSDQHGFPPTNHQMAEEAAVAGAGTACPEPINRSLTGLVVRVGSYSFLEAAWPVA